MVSTAVQHSYSHYRASLRSRLISGGLSAAVLGLLALMLLSMGVLSSRSEDTDQLVAIDLTRPAGPTPQTKRNVAKTAPKAAAELTPVPTAHPRAVTPVPVPVQPPVPPLNLIRLSRQQMAAADIGAMPRGPAAGNGAAGSGAPGAGAAGNGEGPGGAHLYNAQWYREPSRAELSTYLASAGRGGEWGMIACRTIANYRVEDCQELGESPRGSGLARALRQASWQFMVRPPRLDGKPIIGAWVRIRFDFTKVAADKRDTPPDGDAAG